MTRLLLAALLLVGCVPQHVLEAVKDRDSDGFDHTDWGGTDCDDSDQSVNPDADEFCNDGIDNDCDGNIDDFGTGETAWYIDADGDGFGDPDQPITACGPPEGYVGNADDCDDDADQTHPGADEVCDGADNDCDTEQDEGAVDAPTWYFDDDGDGYGVDDTTVQSCTQPVGFAALGGDCDDVLTTVNPGEQEVCSGRDDDCDTLVDQDDPSMSGVATWYFDGDGDSYGIVGDTLESCTQPEDYAPQPGDCNDADELVNPGADEVCNAGIDDDCNAFADDADAGLLLSSRTTWYLDDDHDDYGIDTVTVDSCVAPADYVALGGDCDDGEEDINPGATEVCNGVDDDCDTLTDDADSSLDPFSRDAWYFDDDGDGYGVTASQVFACAAPLVDDWVLLPGDCNDASAAINPGATEVCGGGDEDCDLLVDDADDSLDLATRASWYFDDDGDDYGVTASESLACAAPGIDWVALADDCDDVDPAINPGANEVCNGYDDNCDVLFDDNDPALVLSSRTTWYFDDDGDDYGVDTDTVDACAAPNAYVALDGDCDDGNAFINPLASEVCNGVDDDCDALTDDDDNTLDLGTRDAWFFDDDGDGYGVTASQVFACDAPVVDDWVLLSGDCNDGNTAINPGQTEVCNGFDDNCDTEVDDADDELDPSSVAAWYEDLDGDDYGVTTTETLACDPPTVDWVLAKDDCDDDAIAINPGATEVCNGDDDDCDTLVDDADDSVDPATQTTWFYDDDGDSYGVDTTTALTCVAPPDFVALDGDCDDDDELVNPAATEVCNGGTDDNCDGQADDADPDDLDPSTRLTWYLDEDGDGYGQTSNSTPACAAPTVDHVLAPGDCDHLDPAINPGATEVCNGGTDDNCNGDADDDDLDNLDFSTRTAWYLDSDDDSYGDPTTQEFWCAAPTDFVARAGDCDDGVSAVNPDATEVCNGDDDDCDTLVDDADDSVDPSSQTTWYFDDDDDTYGVDTNTQLTCVAPTDYVALDGDCDDGDPLVHPLAAEVCNGGTDDDCNNVADDADAGVDPTTFTHWFFDDDGDTYGVTASLTAQCAAPGPKYVVAPGDCNDASTAVNPGATEVCNGGIDDNCDGEADDADVDDLDQSTWLTWYYDNDGDGYGEIGNTAVQCAAPDVEWLLTGGDCNDDNQNIHPGATEVCNLIDDDCDSDVDGDDDDVDPSSQTSWYFDGDGDGYGVTASEQLDCDVRAAPWVLADDDCDDGYDSAYPGAPELCDGVLNDCDGTLSGGEVDDDGDGYVECDLDPVVGWQGPGSNQGGDCDDTAVGQFGIPGEEIHPFAPEICNDRVDNDCDSDWEECRLSGDISLGAADVVFVGEPVLDWSAGGQLTLGDLTNDGVDDLVVGFGALVLRQYFVRGGVYTVLGPTFTPVLTPADATAEISSTVQTNFVTIATVVCDLDDDGLGDIFVGFRKYDSELETVINSTVRGFRSPSSGFVNYAGQSDWTFQSPESSYGYYAGCQDVDGDGRQDLVLEYDGVRVFRGPLALGTYEPDDADLTIMHSGSDFAAGGLGDLDGDGAAEITARSTTSDSVYVVAGDHTGTLSTSVAEATISGVTALRPFVADYNGDGDNDLIFMDIDADAARGFDGPWSLFGQTVDATLSDVTIGYGLGSNWRVSLAGDIDGDGADDLAFSDPDDDTIGPNAGVVHVVYGGPQLTGSTPLAVISHARLYGEADGDAAGLVADVPGDINGDGFDDLVVRASSSDSTAQDAGQVYIFFGKGM